MTLGHFPQMPLTEARIRAQEARQQARAGRDPAQDARDTVGQRGKEQDDRQARNFKAMMELYISRVANHQKSGAEKTRSIRKYAIAEFGRRPLDGITTQNISAFLHRLHDQSGMVQANRMSAYLSAALNWLVKNGFTKINAASSIGRVSANPERPRDRVLTDEEIKAIWQVIEEMPKAFGRIVQVGLLTAQRRGTIAAMMWDDLDLGAGLWSVRGEDMKSGRRHEVPLSTQAVAVLRAIPRQQGGYVFGKAGAGPFSGFSKGKQELLEASGTTEWRLHDVRRTANTGLIGFADKDVRRRILDHRPSGRDVEAIHYDQFDWQPRMQAALEQLGNHIDDIVTGGRDNVVNMGESA